jgi:hypothetical protein
MAHRSHPVARLALATSVLGLALVSVPLAAGAQEATAAPPTLAQVLDGEVAGLSAEAHTSSGMEMGVRVEVTNDTGRPVDVAIPFGTLVVTEDEGDQTLAVVPPTSPEVIDVAASGGTPTVEADAGTSTLKLDAYCTEMEDGYPYEDAEVTPIDDAHPVLAETLREVTAAGADGTTVQDAIWWLTDQPTVPVPDHLTGLLSVDTAAFAAEPHLVTPDTGYVPLWMREQVDSGDAGDMENPRYDDSEAAGILDESFEGATGVGSSSDGGGSAGGSLLWLVLIGLVVTAAVVIATRAGGRSGPAPVVARVAPGWYPDPWGGGAHRYWDGQSWTSRVM